MISALILILIAFVAVFVFCCSVAITEFVRRHGAFIVLYRAMSGQHLDGHHRTNRTFLHRGTRATGADHRKPTTRWSRTPMLHRMGILWGAGISAAWLMAGMVLARQATEAALISLLSAVLIAGTARVVWRVRRREHRRHVEQPLATALSGYLGASPQVICQNLRIHKALESRAADRHIGSLGCIPDTWHGTDSERQAIEQLVQARLPVQVSFSWQLHKHPMSVSFLAAQTPPPLVKLADWAPEISELPAGRYFLGIAAGDEQVGWDATEEDPMGAANSRTRGGKTNYLSAIIAQGLARGEEFWAVDPKRVSLRHFAGVPGFRLACNPARPNEMVGLISAFRAAMDEAIATGDTSQHRTLVLEECNMLQALIDDWWIAAKANGQRMIDNPAWMDVKAVLYQGAQFNHRVLVSGQDLKDKVLFGCRSQFGTIAMNGYKPAVWRYVVGTTPIPAEPRKRGRFYIVRAGVPELVQVVIADEKSGAANEAAWRQYALAGRAPEEEWVRPKPWHKVPALRPLPPAPDPLLVPALPPILVGYAEAAGYLGLSPNAFELRRKRRPIEGEFTTTMRGGRVKPCWHKDTLDLWAGSVQGVRQGGPRERVEA